MKYDLQVEIQSKEAAQYVSFRCPEPIAREFKYIVKQTGRSMTHVLTEIIKEFTDEAKSKGKPKQQSLF